MKQILHINPNKVEVNTLFIQPTHYCGLNCDGCYVKAHFGQKHQVSAEEQVRLFKMFWSSDKAWANQITVSIDDVPDYFGGKQTDHLRKLTHSILRVVEKDERARHERPELHFTMHSLNTWDQYEADGDIKLLRHLDVLSISSKSRRDEYIKEYIPSTIFNRNYMCPPGCETWDFVRVMKHVTSEVEWSSGYDHIYFIIQKLPLGVTYYPEILEQQKKYVTRAKEIYTIFQDKLGNKISLDSCVSDSIKSKTTGFGCSANVSKFQVWPDGTVSGCPYSFRGHGKVGNTAEDILDNIREARRVSDFKKCYLPTVC